MGNMWQGGQDRKVAGSVDTGGRLQQPRLTQVPFCRSRAGRVKLLLVLRVQRELIFVCVCWWQIQGRGGRVKVTRMMTRNRNRGLPPRTTTSSLTASERSVPS